MYAFAYTLSPTCAVKTLKPQCCHLYKVSKLVPGIIYKLRKQMKCEKKSKYPMRRLKFSFSLQGGPCVWAALPAWAHFNFPRTESGGHEEITRVPQTLQTRWQLWSPTSFTKSGLLLKVSTEETTPVGGAA